jgi:hypothetical protein
VSIPEFEPVAGNGSTARKDAASQLAEEKIDVSGIEPLDTSYLYSLGRDQTD